MTTENIDDFLKQEETSGADDNEILFPEPGQEETPEPGSEGEEDKGKKVEGGKVDYKKKFEDMEKSYKSQQKFGSKLQAQIKDITNSQKKRDQAMLEALGGGEKSIGEEQAKKLATDFEEKPISVIEQLVSNALDKELPGIKKSINMNKVNQEVGKTIEKIEAQYEVDFTPELQQDVGNILEQRFSQAYRKANPEQAILEATQLALGNKGETLKKREDGLMFVDKGSHVEVKGKAKSEAQAIKDGILGAKRMTKKKLFE